MANKKAYVGSLKDKLDLLPNNFDRCAQKQLTIEAQLSDNSSRLSALLAEKSGLDNQIQENQLKLNAYVSQRNSKEQEPINIVRELERELHDLKFKVGTIPGIKSDLDTRNKAIRKAEDALADLRRRIDSDGKNSYELESNIASIQREIDTLKRQIESNKIKLAMRRMKLELANSNRAIKEHLMSLIRTNHGEPVDFQVLISTSENARKEIRRILRTFIEQSAGSNVEINISEAQLDDIISKDQKEFDEIRRIYTELVTITNQYGDFSVYISGISQDIKDLDSRLVADERTIKDLPRKLREAKASLDGQGARKDGIIAEIERTERFISDNRRHIDDKEIEIRRWEDDFDKLKLKKDLYVQEHKV